MNIPRKIYAIRHNVTNRVYVGSSCRADKRFMNHLYMLRGHKHHIEDMQADFDKFGENYTFTILEDINEYDDRNKEYEWMKKLQSNIRGIGYNYKDQKWRGSVMTDNERDLVDIIRDYDNPEETLIISAEIIGDFIKGENER